MLRRMKEDVENLPDKEEVVVWVELTTEQRHFYKAIYGKQVRPCLRTFNTVLFCQYAVLRRDAMTGSK